MTDENADQGKTEVADTTGSNPSKSAPTDTAPISSDISFDVGLPRKGVAPNATPYHMIPQSQPEPIAPPSGDIHDDIEKILREVKLPERRETKGIADKKIPAFSPGTSATQNATGTLAGSDSNSDDAASGVIKMPTPTRVASVHTLKDDLQHVVKEKKISLVRAVALEQDKKSRADEVGEADFGRSERSKRVVGIVFAILLLSLLGGAALFGVYFVMMGHSATNTQQVNSIVFAEQSVALPISGVSALELKRRIASARQTQSGSLGSITRIVPVMDTTEPATEPRPATLSEFFSAIGVKAPADLARFLSNDFFFGLHVVDKNSPVLVIPVISYEHVFADMLAWESTMNADLSPAFTPLPATILDTNGIPSARIFKDDVMRNYDVRELKDDAGQVQLYYSFPSPNLLVIAESPYSFPELLSRLQSVRRL